MWMGDDWRGYKTRCATRVALRRATRFGATSMTFAPSVLEAGRCVHLADDKRLINRGEAPSRNQASCRRRPVRPAAAAPG
jgi:hypothetical protein